MQRFFVLLTIICTSSFIGFSGLHGNLLGYEEQEESLLLNPGVKESTFSGKHKTEPVPKKPNDLSPGQRESLPGIVGLY